MEVVEEFGYSKVCAYWLPKIPADAHKHAREANANYSCNMMQELL